MENAATNIAIILLAVMFDLLYTASRTARNKPCAAIIRNINDPMVKEGSGNMM